MKSKLCLLIFCCTSYYMFGQKALVGLPMAGHVSPSSANILVLTKTTESLWVKYWTVEGDTATTQFFPAYIDTLKKFNLHYYKFKLENLTAQQTYQAQFFINKITTQSVGDLTFSTPPAINTVTDFSFTIGSCAAPFKGLFVGLKPSLKIFDAMTKNQSDFMIWMGDNLYYLFNEWWDYEKMINKNLDYRTNKKISRFLNSRPQYATWDDHDYGPNNAAGGFKNKKTTLGIFKNFWANDSWGLENTAGVFGKFSYSDVDFFMMDSRYHRIDKVQMYGKEQLEWLKKGLKNSTASFKFIISGTQVLPHTGAEDLGDYPNEHADLMNFLKAENITGVIFFSGDRHFAELIKKERKGTYPLHEMTSSALTSFYFPGSGKQEDGRVEGTFWRKRNFGRVSVEGDKANRKCTLELFRMNGKPVWKQEFLAKDLK